MWPFDSVSVVGVLKLVDDQPQRKDLLIDSRVGQAGVHRHLGVLGLSGQAVVGHPLGVGAPLPSVPAVVLHLVLAGAQLRVLAQDVGQLAPEAAGPLHARHDLVDQGVQAGGLLVVVVERRRLVAAVVAAEAAAVDGAPPTQPRFAAVLKHLENMSGLYS